MITKVTAAFNKCRSIESDAEDVVPAIATKPSLEKMFIPLVSNFTWIRSSIKQFTLSNYKNDMTDSQIKVLNLQLMRAIKKDIEYRNIKKSARKGDLEPLSKKTS